MSKVKTVHLLSIFDDDLQSVHSMLGTKNKQKNYIAGIVSWNRAMSCKLTMFGAFSSLR